MKHDQQQEAQRLYFQTDMNKSDIAVALGLSRRTLHYWIRHHNWDRMKKNAECMPAFLAENCYQLLANYTEQLLSEERVDMPLTLQEVNATYRLVLAANKLKRYSTLNESMEMLTLLTEDVAQKDSEFAEKMQPYINEYISRRSAPGHKKYKPAKFNDAGYIPSRQPATEELLLDLEDFKAWEEEKNTAPVNDASSPQPAPTSSSTLTPTPTPTLSDTPVTREELSKIYPPIKPKTDLRKMLRGTAGSGPGKVLKRDHPAAA